MHRLPDPDLVPLGSPIYRTAVFAIPLATGTDRSCKGCRNILDWGETGELCIFGIGLARLRGIRSQRNLSDLYEPMARQLFTVNWCWNA